MKRKAEGVKADPAQLVRLIRKAGHYKQHKTMKVRLAKKLALRPMRKLSTRWIMRFFNNDARFDKAFRMIKRKRK